MKDQFTLMTSDVQRARISFLNAPMSRIVTVGTGKTQEYVAYLMVMRNLIIQKMEIEITIESNRLRINYIRFKILYQNLDLSLTLTY